MPRPTSLTLALALALALTLGAGGSGCGDDTPLAVRIVPPRPTATADTIVQLAVETKDPGDDLWRSPAGPIHWTVVSGGGAVTKGGFFAAPERAGVVTVGARVHDGSASATITVVLPADRPSPSPTPSQTPSPAGVILVFDNTNAEGGAGGGRLPTFGMGAPRTITTVTTVHTAAATARPGTIALRSRDGATFGPWRCRALPGGGTSAGVFWECAPGAPVPRGVYTIVDSDQASLLQNARSGGTGMAWVCGW